MATIDKIRALTIQLLPTGRAFWKKIGGVFDTLIEGLIASEQRAYDDAVSILDNILPDNSNFTTDDATAWEIRLGLITSSLVPLADRKDAIKRKINHPGTVPARQNYRYLQGQLQAAGFDVYVYENRFPDGGGGYYTKSPTLFSLLPYPRRWVMHSNVIQHGQVQHGYTFGNKVVNHIEESLDAPFGTGNNLRSTFFVGGATPGSWAIVDVNRKDEFRQLILKIKPVQEVGFLLVNFY